VRRGIGFHELWGSWTQRTWSARSLFGNDVAVIWSRDGRDVPFEEHYRSLLDHAYYIGFRFFSGDNHLAEEVAQETLTRAYERWDRVARHPNREAWVMNAAWKVSMEIQRQQSRPPAVALVDLAGVAEDLTVERPILIKALARLTSRQRTVAMARYYFGYDVAETAALLGMTESQVRTASHEATLKLRRLLGSRAPSGASLADPGVSPA
jgi:RNA polymerase sigma factor (sigma-70 family)